MPDMSDRLNLLEVRINNRLTQIEEDTASLRKSVDDLTVTLRGDGSNMGLISKIYVVWSSYVWILCTISAGLGFIAHWGFSFLTK